MPRSQSEICPREYMRFTVEDKTSSGFTSSAQSNNRGQAVLHFIFYRLLHVLSLQNNFYQLVDSTSYNIGHEIQK